MIKKNKMVTVLIVLMMIFVSGSKLILADEQAMITVSVEKSGIDQTEIYNPELIAINSGASINAVLRGFLNERILWEDGKVTGVCPTESIENRDNWIMNGDYQAGSQWQIILNGQTLSGSGEDYPLYSGDQLHLVFSFAGQEMDWPETELASGDATELVELMEKLQADENLVLYEEDYNFSQLYNQAREVLESACASQEKIDALVKQLDQAIPVIIGEIAFEEKELSLLVNETYLLGMTIYADDQVDKNDVIWTSSDESVLAVNENGEICAKSSGTAFITASAPVGTASDTCQVNVTEISLAEINLSTRELSLEEGDEYQLGVCFYPENTTDKKTVSWFSSDDAIVRVSVDGKITALGGGIASITAVTEKGIFATCQVKVDSIENLAAAIENRIADLPEYSNLTLDCTELDSVYDEYQAASQKIKNCVDPKLIIKLNDLMNRMTELQNNQQLADLFSQEVFQLSDISELILNDEATVAGLINYYETELSPEQQILIDAVCLDKLYASQEQIDKIKKINQQKASRVMGLVADLPLTAELELADEIILVRKDYNELSDDQKNLVENIGILESLESDLISQIENRVSQSTSQDCLNNDAAMNSFILASKVYEQLTENERAKMDIALIERIEAMQKEIESQRKVDSKVLFDLPFHLITESKPVIVTDEMLQAVNQKLTEAGADEALYLRLYQVSVKDLYQYQEEVKYPDVGNVSIPLLASESPELIYSGLVFGEDQEITVYENSGEAEKSVTFTTSSPVYIGIIGRSPVLETEAVTVTEEMNKQVEQAYDETTSYMMVAAAQPTIQSGLWETLCFARSDYPVPEGYYEAFYNNVLAEIQEGEGSISGDRTNTDYAKTILALTAIGKDPTDVGGYNLLEKLANFEKIKKNGMMAYVWALIALDSGNYEIPVTDSGTQTTRELLIKTILEREVVTANGVRGGFSLFYNANDAAPDTDVTAMTLQALAKYKDREDVKPVIERTLNTLSGLQNDNGSYGTFGAPETSESTAQVILALTSLGIDPAVDMRFIKGENWLLSDLMKYYVDGGGFMHVKTGGLNNGGGEPGSVNGMASYQATQAIIAYQRFLTGKAWIFDVTDGFSPVIDDQKKMEDLENQYNNTYGGGSSDSGNQPTSSTGGTSLGGGTVASKTASSGGGTVKAADKEFTPWSFEGDLLEVKELEKNENKEMEIVEDGNIAVMVGGGIILLVAASGGVVWFRKKRIKSLIRK